jgi:AP-2 complex subunit sigma-1
LIEQYDPQDVSSPTAVSQPYAFVAAKVHVFGENMQHDGALNLDLDNIVSEGPGLSENGLEALSKLRDTLAPDEKIGWYIVYNGDPQRLYPGMDGEDVKMAETSNRCTENAPETPAVCSDRQCKMRSSQNS